MQLSVRERVTLGLVVCLGILDTCNVAGLFTGIAIMVGDEDEEDDMVPIPIMVSFFVGSVACLVLAMTLWSELWPRRSVVDSDDSDDESDDDDHVYG